MLRSLSLSLALLCVCVCATVSYAQAPGIRVALENDRMEAGLLVFMRAEVTLGADAPGDPLITYDPLGVGKNTFVMKFSPSRLGIGGQLTPCPADRHCFIVWFATDYRLAPGDYTLPVTLTDSQGRRATTSTILHSLPPLDRDNDGLPDFWESEYSLSSASADGNDGPSGDPDGDGISNLDEFRAASNPVEKYARLFAEGSSGDRQPLQNCVSVVALGATQYASPVRVLFLGDDGRRIETTSYLSDVAAKMCPFLENQNLADRVVAVRVEASAPFAAERDTTSGFSPVVSPATPQLANASIGMQEPSRTWVFADGHTNDGIDEFLLLYNPTGAPVEAQFSYVRAPATVVARKTRVLPPGVRTTVWLNQDDGDVLPDDASVLINANAPILAERAFRFQAPGRTVPHDSVTRGAWVSSTRWYFPDVDGRGPFQSSLVLMNPGTAPTTVSATVQFADRAPMRTQLTLIGGERRVLGAGDLSVPAGTAYGVSIESAAAIVAERAWSGATASGGWWRSAIGAMQSGTQWVFAGGGMPNQLQSDLVIMNASDTSAHVTIKMVNRGFDDILRSEGSVDVPARGSLHVPIGVNDPARTIPVISGGTITIDSSAPIVVERTTYWDLDGVPRGRATSVIGNQLQ